MPFGDPDPVVPARQSRRTVQLALDRLDSGRSARRDGLLDRRRRRVPCRSWSSRCVDGRCCRRSRCRYHVSAISSPRLMPVQRRRLTIASFGTFHRGAVADVEEGLDVGQLGDRRVGRLGHGAEPPRAPARSKDLGPDDRASGWEPTATSDMEACSPIRSIAIDGGRSGGRSATPSRAGGSLLRPVRCRHMPSRRTRLAAALL